MEGITMARPSFKIDPARLRSLREESNQTQLEVANKAHLLLKKPSTASEKTILNVYQRIEHTGKTSKKMADAIAQVFDVSVELLQGIGALEEPEEIISQVEQQLLLQRNIGNNDTLLHALNNHFASYETQLGEDYMFREFAEDIARQISSIQIALQFGHDADEIASLVAITGWTEDELKKLGDIDGHWLFLERARLAEQTIVTQRMSAVCYEIQERFANNHLRLHEGDISITFVRSLPWLHIEVTHPTQSLFNCKFSFVRCKPNTNGFKWVNPSWRDDYWLNDLKDWAFRNASFITDFDGNHYPGDLYNLRLEIQEINQTNGTRRVAYSKGYLEELPGEVLERFKAAGESHFLVIDWLASGCADSLAPHLRKLPHDCWKIRNGYGLIVIEPDLPYRLGITTKKQSYDNKYSVKLVEEVSAGKYRPAPWPNRFIEHVISKFKDRLFRENDSFDNDLQFNGLPHDDSDLSVEAK